MAAGRPFHCGFAFISRPPLSSALNRTYEGSSRMNSRFFALCLLFVTGPLFAGTEINSYFGFNAVLPSGWVQVGPTAASTMEVDDFAKGSPINKETLNQIREKVAGKEVEFFYDIQSLESEFKLNISVQKSEPVLVDSLQELNSECSGLPE